MGTVRLFIASLFALFAVTANASTSGAGTGQVVIFSKTVIKQTERFPEGRPFTSIELIQNPGLHKSMEECSKRASAESQRLKANYDGKFWTNQTFPFDFSIWSHDSSMVLSCTTLWK